MSILPLTPAPRMTRIFCLLLGSLIATCIAQAEPERIVLDALGRAVLVVEPKRIVSLGSDVTEIVYALGEGERIIAVDRGSQFPAATATKPNVGYRRRLTAEGVASLSADLILAAEDIGPQEAVEVLRELDIPIVFVPDDNSGEGIRRKIEIIARALSQDASGAALAATVIENLEDARELTAGIPDEERKKVVFFHGIVRLTAAGGGTAADAIIKLAGGLNPMDEVSGYKAASEERLVELAPDVILMMSDGNGGPTADQVFSNRALAATPAGRTRSLIVLDGAYMIGFGPRTADAVRDLASALYGDTRDVRSD